MVKQYLLNESNLPPKLLVIFSDEIIDNLYDIRQRNQFEKEGLSRLFSYIKGIKNHISNRAIAFSYGKVQYSYGTSIIYDFGVGFCLEDDSEKVYVKVVWLDLSLEDFGLQENKKVNISRIITETINNYLNRCCRLNEAYLGDLYHLTTLSHLYNILKHNCIYRFEDEYCHKDRRMGTDTNVVCLTRSKEFKDKTMHSVRITLDGELMSSSLRNARIHPFRYYEDGEDNSYGVNNMSEFEERVYNSDIYPLKKYCKSIDIYVGDINKCDYYFCDDVDYANEGLYSSGVTNPTDKQINEWFLTHIVEDFPQWSNIIHIHGFNTINEVLTKNIIVETINQYLEGNIIQ